MKTPRTTISLDNPIFKSLELWATFASNNAAMLWSASEVIGRRTARMAQHGMSPNSDDRREMQRMVDEKQTAYAESSAAAWAQWMQLSQLMWSEALRMVMRNAMRLIPVFGGLAASPLAMRPYPRTYRFSPRAASRAFNAQLRIADAAMKPVRERVKANQRRLSTSR